MYLPIFCGSKETYALFPIEMTAIDQFKFLAEKLPSLHPSLSLLDIGDLTEEVKAMNLDQLDPDQALQNWWQAQLKLIDSVMQEHMQEMLAKIFPGKTTPQARAEQEYLLKSAYIYAFLEVLITNAQITDIFTTTVLSCFSQKIQEKEYAKWFDKQIKKLAENFSGTTLEEWNTHLDVFVESLAGKDSSLIKAAVPKIKEQFNSIEKVKSNWRFDQNKSSQVNFLHYLSNLKLITFPYKFNALTNMQEIDIGRIFDDLKGFAGTAEYYAMFNLPLAAYEEFKSAAHNLPALHPDFSEFNVQDYSAMTLLELDSNAEFLTWWDTYGPAIDMHFYSISGRMLDTLFPEEKGQKAMHLREEGPLREGYLGILFALFRHYANPLDLIDPATTTEQTLVDYVTKNLSQLPPRHGMSLTNQHLDALHDLISKIELPSDPTIERSIRTSFVSLKAKILEAVDIEPVEYTESKTANFENKLIALINSSKLPNAFKLLFLQPLIDFSENNSHYLFENDSLAKQRVTLFQNHSLLDTRLFNKQYYLSENIPKWVAKINGWLVNNQLSPAVIKQEPGNFDFSIIEKILRSLSKEQKIDFLRFCKKEKINTDTADEGNFLLSINSALRELNPELSKAQLDLIGYTAQIITDLDRNSKNLDQIKLLPNVFVSDEKNIVTLNQTLTILIQLLDTQDDPQANAIFLASGIKKINAPAVIKMFMAESIHKLNKDITCLDTNLLIKELSKDLQPSLFLEQAIYDLVDKKSSSSSKLIPHFSAWQADLDNKELIKMAFASTSKPIDLANAMLKKLAAAPNDADGKRF